LGVVDVAGGVLVAGAVTAGTVIAGAVIDGALAASSGWNACASRGACCAAAVTDQIVWSAALVASAPGDARLPPAPTPPAARR